MLRNSALAALLATGAVFGLAACGSDDSPSDKANAGASDGAGQTQEQQKDAENTSVDPEELKKDVKIVDCKSGAGAGVGAVIEVTNSLDEPMEYFGTLTFLDASGKVITDGLFNTGTLQPGETSTEDIPGANVYEVVQGATCEVAEVKLDEPA